MTKNSLIGFFVIGVAFISGILLQQRFFNASTDSNNTSASALHQEWNGQVIMLNFWATWCPPCRKEIPDFVRLQQDLGDQGLQVIGAALDTPDMVAEFIQHTPLNYPNFILDSSDGFDTMEAYGNELGALPYTVFIDRQGNIVERHSSGILSYEDAFKKIQKLL